MNKVSLAPSGLPCIAGSMYEDFGEIRADVTDRLTHAVTDRSVPMHTLVVATADADARVMVLRGVERGGWLLRFHTDARAPKVAAILRDPRIAVLGYDKQAKIQLRMRGRARIERDGARGRGLGRKHQFCAPMLSRRCAGSVIARAHVGIARSVRNVRARRCPAGSRAPQFRAVNGRSGGN